MKNKKGLSAVVTTLIIILLVLVAVGIIWVVIQNVVTEGSEQVKSGASCIGVQVNIKSATCTDGDTCTVVVERLSGGVDVDGVKVTISGETAGSLTDTTSGGLEVLDVVTLTPTGDTLSSGDATVKAAAVLEDGTVCTLVDETTVTVP